ncbi:MAG: 3-deoxy-manno-octulosonate cytidylyltransferase [Bacteroidales bacterium]|jgi:3-deoxy-manno-octulosonate cytidylyltransferase (CMP-KDO synthetase)
MKKASDLKFTGIIPARYASTRFPGKPLVPINGRPMIQMVYESAAKSLENVFVATDDKRICDAVTGFGGQAVMTSPDHRSGTDRCAEAAEIISREKGISIDIVVNVQGDEPFINPAQIDLLKSCFSDKKVEIATLIRKTRHGEDIFNPNEPKVIIDNKGNAIYFSRAAIPFLRDVETSRWTEQFVFYKHPGLYAYSVSVLQKITRLPRSPLELAESLEQNRWIENGFKIRTAVTEWESIGIDTPADLDRALKLFNHFL